MKKKNKKDLRFLGFFLAFLFAFVCVLLFLTFLFPKKELIEVSEPFVQEAIIIPTVEVVVEEEVCENTIEQTPSEFLEYISTEVEPTPIPTLPVSERYWDEAVYMAKVIYGESLGVYSQTEQACVAWTILNRSDDGVHGDDIIEVCTASGQFAYNENFPTVDDYGRDLVELALDVLERWEAEKNGEEDVGRVLPKGYYYFGGDGEHNWFRKTYEYSSAWDYSLPSPYDS